MSSCKKKMQLYDPINNKCYGIKSKKGQDLSRLIKLCRNYKDIDIECDEINKIYLTKYIKFKQILKKIMIPLFTVVIFNLLIFLLLSSSSIRNKIIKFSIKHIYLNDNPALIPLLELIPVISKFVEDYGAYARSIIFGISVSDTLKILNSLVVNTINNPILLTDPKFNKNVQNLVLDFKKEAPNILPGAWVNSPILAQISNIPTIENKVNTIIDSKGKVSTMFSLFSDWL